MIEATTYYEAHCDACGEVIELAGEFTAYPARDCVAEAVADQDGIVVGDLVACSGCLEVYTADLGDAEREELDWHDDMARAACQVWLTSARAARLSEPAAASSRTQEGRERT